MMKNTGISQALNGIKIVDLTWLFMGPMITKVLADHGAEVVKIESSTRPDLFRTAHPFPGGKPNLNRSGSFAITNSSKHSMGLNLSHPKALPIIRRLVLWADVLIESFIPGTVNKWGLGYEQLKKIKPDIIMVSASIQGQTGPHAQQRGFGDVFSAMMGFPRLTGRPDRAPSTTFAAYTDFIAPWYALVGIIGGLMYRHRTGKGQYIDISQLETATHFLAPALLDYGANGRIQRANGNRASYAAPHGAYRCKGDDRWCVVAVFTDEEWKALCTVIGAPELAEDPRFSTIVARKKNEDELDKLVETWTSRHSPNEVMTLLQTAGVTAGAVQNGQDLPKSPSLIQRGFFQILEHSEMGKCTLARPPFKLSKTPSQMRPMPLLGEHTEYVCTKLLGIPDNEFVELLSTGVFG